MKSEKEKQMAAIAAVAEGLAKWLELIGEPQLADMAKRISRGEKRLSRV